jgi:hypothetical protein
LYPDRLHALSRVKFLRRMYGLDQVSLVEKAPWLGLGC